MSAQQAAARLEARRWIEPGESVRFSGYALLDLHFESGHVIALRRASASSVGPPFSELWVRAPGGEWAVHANVEPARGAARFLGASAPRVMHDDIDIRWNGPHEVGITARAARLHLALRLARTPAALLASAALWLLPRRAWRAPQLAERLAAGGARLLGTDRLRTRGRTPSGYAFEVAPRSVWHVSAAAAVLDGADLGRMLGQPMRSDRQDSRSSAARGLFVVADAAFVRDAVAAAVTGGAESRDTVLWRVLVNGSAAAHTHEKDLPHDGARPTLDGAVADEP